MQELCAYLSDNWQEKSPIHLSAYAMWRLLWVHPFADANGRVARVWSYAILCSKLKAFLPGSPTLSEILLRKKSEYYLALEAADIAAVEGHTDVSKLEKLIEDAIIIQLTGMPLLPDRVRKSIDDQNNILSFKIPSLRRTIYSDGQIFDNSWIDGPLYFHHFGNKGAVEAAKWRRSHLGSPYPNAVRVSRERADHRERVYKTFSNQSFQSADAPLIRPDNGFLFYDCKFNDSEIYGVEGCLFVVSLGPLTTVEEVSSVIELLSFRLLRELA